MGTMPMAISSSGVKIVANVAFWNRSTFSHLSKKSRSYLHTPKNVQACAESSVLSVSAAIHRRMGSNKDQQNPKLEETLFPAQAEDVLEVDETWSFV